MAVSLFLQEPLSSCINHVLCVSSGHIRHTVVSHEINRFKSMDVSEVSKWRVGCLKVLLASLMLIKADVTFREHTITTQPLCSSGCKCSGNPLFVCLRACLLASGLMSTTIFIPPDYIEMFLWVSFSQSFRFSLQCKCIYDKTKGNWCKGLWNALHWSKVTVKTLNYTEKKLNT